MLAVALDEELEQVQEEDDRVKDQAKAHPTARNKAHDQARAKTNTKNEKSKKADSLTVGKNVMDGIKRIHDSAKLHKNYKKLRSPVDKIFMSDKFDEKNIHVYDLAALIPLAQEKGHFNHKDEELVAEALAWQQLVLWGRHEHSGFAAWEKVLRLDLAEQRRIFYKYGLVDGNAPKFWEANTTNATTPTLHEELKKQQMLLMKNGLKDDKNVLQKKYDELAAKTETHDRVLPDNIEQQWLAQWRKAGLIGKQHGKRTQRHFKLNVEPIDTELELEEAETKHGSSRRLLSMEELKDTNLEEQELSDVPAKGTQAKDAEMARAKEDPEPIETAYKRAKRHLDRSVSLEDFRNARVLPK